MQADNPETEPRRCRIVFNADDFGLTPGINAGIVHAYRNGVVRSTSLVPGGPAFDDAVSRAATCGYLGVGVHLYLTQEAPVAGEPVVEQGSLDGEGRFPGLGTTAMAAFRDRIDIPAVEREWRAQIEKVMEAGITPTHLDGHQWAHMLPGLFPLCVDLAREFGISRIRTHLRDRLAKGAGLARYLEWRLLHRWCRRHVLPHLPGSMPAHPTIGFLHAGGRLSVDYVADMLGRLAEHHPVVEVMLHPGQPDGDSEARYGGWGYDWEHDRGLAESPELSRALLGFRPVITSFGDLPE
ncbi:MAG: carbohydrate deacetylase [Desulfatibacillaceae bacterium]